MVRATEKYLQYVGMRNCYKTKNFMYSKSLGHMREASTMNVNSLDIQKLKCFFSTESEYFIPDNKVLCLHCVRFVSKLQVFIRELIIPHIEKDKRQNRKVDSGNSNVQSKAWGMDQ